MRKEGAFFLSEVYIDNVLYGSGDGFSKRESQQKAGREAISKLGI
jgi:dsRNA-specific ribonuclease